MKIMGDDKIIEGDVDLISTLPDVILQDILCFIPTKLAISTSLLSRRWRHVWCDMPSLSLDVDTLTATSVNQTLTRYTAPKTTSFHLAITPITENIPYIDRLIKLAMSRHVKSLSLHLCSLYCDYELPEFFCNSSSVKQLNINLGYSHMIVPPQCTVSWTSLQKVSMRWSSLSDDFMAKILSGCPVLENLTLDQCDKLKVLDLSKSLRLRTLDVKLTLPGWESTQIVAPHIHSLRLFNSDSSSCTLVDVDSLTEANLEIFFSVNSFTFDVDFLQDMVLKMLEKLQHAEKLTFVGNFVQILSLGEIRGVHFPILKVKTLTLDTMICESVVLGIERLLQNSPDLEKLIVGARSFKDMQEKHLHNYLILEGFNLDTSWRSKDGASWNKCCVYVKSKHVASLVELVLKNTKKLDKMVVVLDERYLKYKIKDVFPKLPRNKNVNVVISTTKLMALEKW